MKELINLTNNICYLPADEKPLSADVIFIRQTDITWIFDVGSNEQARNEIEKINGKKNIVISHFHEDHTENLTRIGYDRIYAGDYTVKHFSLGGEKTFAVTEPVTEGNVKIIPVVNSHAKGSLILQCGKFVFLGDCIYPTEKRGRTCYNVQQLNAQIKIMEEIDGEFFCTSHARILPKSRDAVITHLKDIYKMRTANEPWIFL